MNGKINHDQCIEYVFQATLLLEEVQKLVHQVQLIGVVPMTIWQNVSIRDKTPNAFVLSNQLFLTVQVMNQLVLLVDGLHVALQQVLLLRPHGLRLLGLVQVGKLLQLTLKFVLFVLDGSLLFRNVQLHLPSDQTVFFVHHAPVLPQ